MSQKIVEGLKRLSKLPEPLKLAYAKSGFDYFFPKLNLINTLKLIASQTKISPNQIFAVVDSTFRDQTLLDLRNSRAQANGMLSDHELNFIHALVLLAEPETVIETGVASGGSSAAILSALCKIEKGKLISIDLPCVKKNDQVVCMSKAYQFEAHETSTVSDFESAGWLVSRSFKHRWSLHLDDSLVLLPQLLKGLGTIDLFLHDSFHSYSHMKSELQMVWPYLNSGGLLLADDIFAFGHCAFSDFAREIGRKFFSYSGIGIVIK